MYAANQIEDEELKAKLPKPTGYHVLIAVPEMSTKTDGRRYYARRVGQSRKKPRLLSGMYSRWALKPTPIQKNSQADLTAR
jgi:hypothetical protein